jgi:hypothetical protein
MPVDLKPAVSTTAPAASEKPRHHAAAFLADHLTDGELASESDATSQHDREEHGYGHNPQPAHLDHAEDKCLAGRGQVHGSVDHDQSGYADGAGGGEERIHRAESSRGIACRGKGDDQCSGDDGSRETEHQEAGRAFGQGVPQFGDAAFAFP